MIFKANDQRQQHISAEQERLARGNSPRAKKINICSFRKILPRVETGRALPDCLSGSDAS
jgi:hypothetical protein